jgi:hypothetical protein
MIRSTPRCAPESLKLGASEVGEKKRNMKKLIMASAFLAALSLPALADPDNGNGNKLGWDNPNNPHL